MLVLSHGEMAEWLKALVLKVLPELRKPYKSRVSPMFDIGVLLFVTVFDGRNAEKGCHQICEKSDGSVF